MINYFEIINKYISPHTCTYRIYVVHATLVTNKALHIARKLSLPNDEKQFIEEASMLHDIGVIKVDSTKMDCAGDLPYIAHGVCGRDILLAENLPAHAAVAANHVGVGLTKTEIIARDLPLPAADYIPCTLAEEIITYSDLFFSKREETLWQKDSPAQIETELAEFGEDQVQKFRDWHSKFGD